MSYTKRQFVNKAFSKIGLGVAFDLQPEQLQTGLEELDAMMAEWNSQGIRVGYPIPSSPENSDLDQETEVADSTWSAIFSNLAVRISPDFGKIISPELKKAATMSYSNLLRDRFQIEERDYQSLPKGAGNKPWRYSSTNRFLAKKQQTIDAGKDGKIDFD